MYQVAMQGISHCQAIKTCTEIFRSHVLASLGINYSLFHTNSGLETVGNPEP
jgi:hypothetical protein